MCGRAPRTRGRARQPRAHPRPHERHSHLGGPSRPGRRRVATTTRRSTCCAASSELHLEFDAGRRSPFDVGGTSSRSRSASTTRCSTTCVNGSAARASPIRSKAPAGSTAYRSTTSASSSLRGAPTSTGAPRRRGSTSSPHFRTTIDGQSIHFVHARSPHADAFPLLLTHGWPGSIVEFVDVIPSLTHPEGHGGGAADAFHVVAPSLPGYGFSEPDTCPRLGRPARRARVHGADAPPRLRTLRRAGRRLGRPGRHEDRCARSGALRGDPRQHADRGTSRRIRAAVGRRQGRAGGVRNSSSARNPATRSSSRPNPRRWVPPSTIPRRACWRGSWRSSVRGVTATAIPRTSSRATSCSRT